MSTAITRFTTDALPAATRMEYLRDSYARVAMAVDLKPLCHDSAFRLDMTVFPLSADAGVTSGLFSPCAFRRSPALAARAGVDAVLLTRFSQPYHFAGGALPLMELAPGDTLVAPMDEAFEHVYPAAGAIRSVWVQRAALRKLLPRMDGRARRLPPSPRLDLLFGYADSVRRDAAFDAPLAGVAAAHLTDLLALALGARGDAAEHARAGGERAARLAALRADVAREYRNPALSVAHLAARHHVSVRYVQRLFEEDGTTFTAFLQGCRLAHVRRLLADPRHARQMVGTLAYEAGFSDLAAFGRLFKRRFGVPPSQVRQEALGRAAHPPAPRQAGG
ncbi:MAG: helix-turn-helix transcriptional regulator [Ottowia sp.]|uniref:helix-turn-helix transcriptional regulator n=1 Tax=Ottowia sp. TaxID=1898956 RepID=UPI0039E5979C